jgi:hypothetical protein
VRLEWTLTGKAAIERHLGGNKIKDLLSADLNLFAKHNLQLEKVDRDALGRLVSGLKLNRKSPAVVASLEATCIKKRFKDPLYRSRRAIELILRNFAYREARRFGSVELALLVCQNSPAEIRGYLHHLQKLELLRKNPSSLTSKQKTGLRKRGRPKQGRRPRRFISASRINGCFQRIQLKPVHQRKKPKPVQQRNQPKPV